MIAWLKTIWSRISRLLRRRREIPKPPEVEGPPERNGAVVLDTRAREHMQAIGPDAWIENTSDKLVTLEGMLIKKLVIPAHGKVRVHSPVLEMVQDPTFRNLHKLREWDALFVADNMVKEYARGIAYDVMTPEELRHCTLPFPDRALGVILERTGLKAHR